MIKLLLTFASIVLLNLDGHTLNFSRDTIPSETPIPNADLQKVLIAAETSKGKLIAYEKLVSELETRIDGLLRSLSQLEHTDSLQSELSKVRMAEILNLQAQKNELQLEIDRLYKEVRKEKRKRFWTTVAAIASIGITIFLMK